MSLSQFLSIIEIRTKIVSVSSFALGTLFAALLVPLDPLIAGVMALAVLAVDMGTTAFNTFFDYVRQVDTADYLRESEKVLLHDGVPPGVALLVAAGLFLVAIALGVVLAFLVGIEIAVVGAVSMMVGFFYTGGPRPLSFTPFGELFAGGFLGSLLFLLSAYVHTRFLTAEMVMASLPSFFLVASILSVNNACDREGDRAAGRRTLAILLGERWAPYLVYSLGGIAYLSAFYALPSDTIHVVVLTTALTLSVWVFRSMHRRGYRHQTKPASMGSISIVFILYTLGAATILIDRLAG